MTLQELKQQIAKLSTEYEYKVQKLEDEICKIHDEWDEAALTLEDKYTEYNRKYPNGYKVGSSTIKAAALDTTEIEYLLSNGITIKESDI